ncbi:MAG: hypothetical protein K2G13_08120 [Muribaculaceae bacterium]|nr:hypothetical protein [Muribaculaceae bacterium]
MENKENTKEIVKKFEDKVREDLISFLQKKEALDPHVPECPDVEEKWNEIGRAYLPDGTREFQDYPVVSLGWMMFIGMAMAYYWDTDWEKNSGRKDFYEKLRDEKGYDNLDETVVEGLLGYSGEAAEQITGLVAECASRVYSLLNHEHVEPGTDIAFGCYIAALHQLYLAGMVVELNALGYHMTALNNK